MKPPNKKKKKNSKKARTPTSPGDCNLLCPYKISMVQVVSSICEWNSGCRLCGCYSSTWTGVVCICFAVSDAPYSEAGWAVVSRGVSALLSSKRSIFLLEYNLASLFLCMCCLLIVCEPKRRRPLFPSQTQHFPSEPSCSLAGPDER